MATTNLISKSLGNILTESGNGVPDHISPKGSMYVDQDTATLYINKDGVTAWEGMRTVSYGEFIYQDNTSQTVIDTTNTWTAVGNNFVQGDVNGFSGNTDTIVLETGRAGKYQINGFTTINFVDGTNNYEVGGSINNNNPVDGTYNGGTVSSKYTTANIVFSFIVELSDGDTIELGIRNLDSTDNIIVQNGQLFAIKID